jgi:hypothetical protein
VAGRCGHPWSWSSDGAKLLYNCPATEAVILFDSKTGVNHRLLSPPVFQVYFSPDDRWLLFGKHFPPARERLFITPFDRMTLAPEKDWIAVTDGSVYEAYGRWSANGDLLYFLSDRDGFRCVWAQPLDHLRKVPSEAAFSIYHAHSARQNLLNVPLNWQDLTVARDKLAFAMGEVSGNIWTTDLKR